MLQTEGSAVAAAAVERDLEFAPVEVIDGAVDSGWLLVCDHASNRMPAEYRSLGLPADQLERHIAYDIGVDGVTRCLASRLAAPAVLAQFSRLLIDPNRGLDDPTLVMRLSDGTVIPGNARIDAAERERRIARFYAPYDSAIKAAIDRAVAAGHPPAILSIHSFTPHWRGHRRPWQVGILWDSDPRLAVPLIRTLERDPKLTVGDNEPYSGRLKGDTMFRHGTRRGLAHALIEVRQDLIATPEGVAEWCDRLGEALARLAGTAGLNEIRQINATMAATTRDQR